jgi:hypothetical protein
MVVVESLFCRRWRDNFEAFLADMPPYPGKGKGWSIERINNDGNYEPGNCKWETVTGQNRNKRTNKLNFDKAVEIILRKLSGESSYHIAPDYNVSSRTVRSIVGGRLWKDASPFVAQEIINDALFDNWGWSVPEYALPARAGLFFD